MMDGLEANVHRERGFFFPETYNGRWGIVVPFNLLDYSPDRQLFWLNLCDLIYYNSIYQEMLHVM